jgi:Leucine-rich repeat (LRR) protein
MGRRSSVIAAVRRRHRDRKLRALPFTAAMATSLFFLVLSPVSAFEYKDINSTRNEERQILVQVYNATNGPQWIRQWGWLNSSYDHCDWEGVRCNKTTTLVVTELHLSGNAMKGNMSQLGGLAHLSFLDLSQNELEGSIEQIVLRDMKKLEHLNLAKNAFDGTLDEVGELSSLVFLDLGNNNFNGTIGQAFGSLILLEHLVLVGKKLHGAMKVEDLVSLRLLDISGNANLTGSLVQSGINNLTMLESLNVAGCNFNGTLDIGNLMLLRFLDLSGNDFSGELAIISNLTFLETLNLAENNFTGTLPEIEALVSPKHLNLSESGNLSGSIEGTGMETLSALESIDLSGNNLTGQIGSQDLGFLGLRSLDLSRNSLSGPLTAISNLTMLEYVNLARNYFNETLPENGNLPALKYVNLSYNELTGTVPNLSGLDLLERLDLSNQLVSAFDIKTGLRITHGITGVIPATVEYLDFLQEFVMSNNLLTGSIPEAFARLNFLHTLDLENNQLSGTIPSSLNLLEKLVTVALARNRLSGPIPELGGSDVVIRTVTLKNNAEYVFSCV